MIDKDGNEWRERGDPIGTVVLFTNRNTMVFNDNGHQIPFYQRAVTSYKINKKLAQEIADKAKEFYIAQFRKGWIAITKLEFEYLLGLRTHKRDIEEKTYMGMMGEP